MVQRTVPWLGAMLMCAALVSARAQSQPPPRDDAKDARELPEGEGKKILLTACTMCHGLEEITKFRGYYTRDDWRDIVTTMVKYGAELKEGETEILVDYLGQHLGKSEDGPDEKAGGAGGAGKAGALQPFQPFPSSSVPDFTSARR
jgi:hypothetical protein